MTRYLRYLSNTLALVIVIYIIFSFALVITYFDSNLIISPALKDVFLESKKKKEGQYTIAIITPTRSGEAFQAKMIYDSAEKMGHLAYIYQFNFKAVKTSSLEKHLNGALISILNYFLKPDFALIMSHHVNVNVPDPKILYISLPPSYYYAKGLQYRENLLNNVKYFLDINLINRSDDWLSAMLEKPVISGYGIVGVPANQYQSSKRQSLLMFGTLWGRQYLYPAMKKLAKQDYMYFVRGSLQENTIGIKLIDELQNPDNLQKLLNIHGIALCPHTANYHITDRIPGSRIFEIISSGAIAISDMHSFVIKNFGDSVLYFDQTLSTDKIFKQIDDHVQWIQQNPEKAEAMAQKAHKILQENFTTERFINDMIRASCKKIFLFAS